MKNAPFDTPIGCSGSIASNNCFSSQKPKTGNGQKSRYHRKPLPEPVEGDFSIKAPFNCFALRKQTHHELITEIVFRQTELSSWETEAVARYIEVIFRHFEAVSECRKLLRSGGKNHLTGGSNHLYGESSLRISAKSKRGGERIKRSAGMYGRDIF